MAKKVKVILKLNIQAGKANPAPPLGPALGQHGVPIMDFCKQYNDKTKDRMGEIVPAVVTIYEDRSFTFIVKTPITSRLILKELAGVEKGSATTGRDKVGKLTRKQLEKIAKIKMPDLTAGDLEAAVRSIAGTARSMGVDIEEG